MKKATAMLVFGWILAMTTWVEAAQQHGSGGKGHSMEQAAPSESKGKAEPQKENAFKHEAVSEDIRAEFQVMTLASMKMKDPEGHTHHVMVTLFPKGSDRPLKEAVGKIKVIRPSQKETVADLKYYDGILAANFTADEPGKYGVICMFKVGEKKPLYKFWYEHQK